MVDTPKSKSRKKPEPTPDLIAAAPVGGRIRRWLLRGLAGIAAFYGVLILLFRPFRIGDWIEARGVSGTVDSIQIFHTVLRTGDNKTVILPNGSLSNGIITNTNRQPTRKVVFDVGVDYEADLQVARKVLLDLANDPRVLQEPGAPQAVISALGDSSITVSLRLWTKTSDYWDVMFMFNEQSRDRLKTAGIDIPFPQRVIRVVQESATQ